MLTTDGITCWTASTVASRRTSVSAAAWMNTAGQTARKTQKRITFIAFNRVASGLDHPKSRRRRLLEAEVEDQLQTREQGEQVDQLKKQLLGDLPVQPDSQPDSHGDERQIIEPGQQRF